MAFFIAKRLRSNVRELEGAEPRYRQRQLHRPGDHHRFRARSAARSAGAAGKTGHHRQYSKDGGGVLQD
nr:hypothetical protein [Klebsiella pneumoniae subsp. pneumoniae]